MTALQPLGQHAQADAVMPHQLQQIAAASAEGIQCAIERILRQHLLHQHRQPLHAFSHIGIAARQVDPDVGLQRDHRRTRAASTRRSAPLSTCVFILPPGYFGTRLDRLRWTQTSASAASFVSYSTSSRSSEAPEWRPVAYHTVLMILRHPVYAGAYVFGRTTQRTHVVDGRARRTTSHSKPMTAWNVLLRDHHPGYITWEQFEENQRLISENAHMQRRTERKSARGGRALLTGLVRCGRCGRTMWVFYGSQSSHAHRYFCPRR
jgi:hypothetical protein